MFQCDHLLQMRDFQSKYCSSLNSPDVYDPELPLKTSRCNGGTMILWRREHDPYVSIPKVSSSAFIPLIYNPPDLPLTIHLAIYLPTAGRENDFVKELAALDACVSDLLDKFPEAIIFLRGDFNVSNSNHNRSSLLNHFIISNSFSSLDIPHTTYHHFLGNGLSDSHLDKIFYSQHLGSPEQLLKIYCKLNNPLIESHHDILLSTVSLPHCTHQYNSENGNITAPRVNNGRTKIVWSEQGIVDYQALVIPKLLLIQQSWLNTPSPSHSIMSLALQSTNSALVESAIATNKSLKLGVPMQPRTSSLPKMVKASQLSLLKEHKEVSSFVGTKDDLDDLKRRFKNSKARHRQLLRTESANASLKRDNFLYKILEGKPSKVFSAIRAAKKIILVRLTKLLLMTKLMLMVQSQMVFTTAY